MFSKLLYKKKLRVKKAIMCFILSLCSNSFISIVSFGLIAKASIINKIKIETILYFNYNLPSLNNTKNLTRFICLPILVGSFKSLYNHSQCKSKNIFGALFLSPP